jgi:hypothetical protein
MIKIVPIEFIPRLGNGRPENGTGTFVESLRKLDQVLNITPDDVDTLAEKAGIAQAEADLPRVSR